MRKSTFILILCFMITVTFSLQATGNNDYRVLKNAMKGKSATQKTATWLRISVTEAGKEKVMIKVPVRLLELFSDCLDEEITVKDGKKVDLKEILDVLVKNGPQTIVEINDDDEVVKIWVE